MTTEKIAILGSGDVARVLGQGLIKVGYKVQLGSRDPKSEKVQNWVSENGSNASAGTSEEAARWGDVIVLATPWGSPEGDATSNAIKLAGTALNNKVLIDLTNPLKFGVPEGPSLAVGHTNSGGELVQSWAPEAHVVKAWNTINCNLMVNPPDYNGQKPTMFIAGNQTHAKKVVTEILEKCGWSTILDYGDIKGARLLEPIAMAWIWFAFTNKKWDHAFALLRK
eukprot:TRINITY_DN4912_c0_g1_i1.p1 TRINITY_DN4912_c0_g1~~TRINITY_DN4912_c0_g1_i1.p1  ORF type:complete len:224 (-),score=40.37 TRINITY_DN4912_c0_g1_i1:49-720(-)